MVGSADTEPRVPFDWFVHACRWVRPGEPRLGGDERLTHVVRWQVLHHPRACRDEVDPLADLVVPRVAVLRVRQIVDAAVAALDVLRHELPEVQL